LELPKKQLYTKIRGILRDSVRNLAAKNGGNYLKRRGFFPLREYDDLGFPHLWQQCFKNTNNNNF
jgi:hypothetical protein